MTLISGHLYVVKDTGHVNSGVLLFLPGDIEGKPTIIKPGSIILYLGDGKYFFNGNLFGDSMATKANPFFYFEPVVDK